MERDAPGVRRADDAPLERLHGEGADHACRDGVEPQVVAQPVGIGHCLGRIDVAAGTEKGGGLVLGALHLVISPARLLGATDGAVEAAGALPGQLLAACLGGDSLVTGELGVAPVVSGEEVPLFLAHADPHHGAEVVAALPVRVGDDVFGELPVQLLEAGGVVVGDFLVALHDERLEILGAHDRAGAAAAVLAVQLGADAGEADAVLAGRADQGHAGLGVRFAERLLRLEYPFAPEVGGVLEADLAGAHMEVDRPVALAGDPDPVEAGLLERRSEVAAGVGVEERAGERRLGADHRTGRRLDLGAGERPGHEDERIFRGERVVGDQPPIHHEFQAGALAADPAGEERRIGLAETERAMGQVNLEKAVHVALVHGVPPVGAGGVSASGRCGAGR